MHISNLNVPQAEFSIHPSTLGLSNLLKFAEICELAVRSSLKPQEEGWKGQRRRIGKGLRGPRILRLTANVWSGRHAGVSVSLRDSFLLQGAAWPEEKENMFKRAAPTVFTGGARFHRAPGCSFPGTVLSTSPLPPLLFCRAASPYRGRYSNGVKTW